MKSSLSLVKSLILVLLAAGLYPRQTRAQAAVEGKFTLPFEAHWGTAVLRPGDYTFSILSSGLPAIVTVRRRARGATVVMTMARSCDYGRSSDQSALKVTRLGEMFVVSSLYVQELGLTFHYHSIPQPKKESLLPRPDTAQHVSVSGAAKSPQVRRSDPA